MEVPRAYPLSEPECSSIKNIFTKMLQRGKSGERWDCRTAEKDTDMRTMNRGLGAHFLQVAFTQRTPQLTPTAKISFCKQKLQESPDRHLA